jgi:hypothetical protein
MKQNESIPDISFHLIFCFLSLNELALVSCCNKEWKRLVTCPSFLNMFRHHPSLRVNQQSMLEASRSLFRQFIHTIHVSDLENLNCLNHFPRLYSLEIEVDWFGERYLNDEINVFGQLNKSLKQLKIYLASYARNETPNIFTSFQKDLCSLTNLTHLYVKDCNRMLTDSWFIRFMKSLEYLEFYDSISQSYEFELIDIIRSLPCLISLSMGNFDTNKCNGSPFIFKKNHIARLCEQPGAPPILQEIRACFDIENHEQDECVQHLFKLPSLKIIACIVKDLYSQIPIFLRPWLSNLRIEFWSSTLSSTDVDRMISLSHLNSLFLYNSDIRNNIDTDLSKLIHGVSSTLKMLNIICLKNHYELSFELLASCKKLESLSCCHLPYTNFKPDQSHLLLDNCPQLHTLRFLGCNLKARDFDIKLPSLSYPNLKIIDIA